MSTPQIHRIADTPPQFPCWVWDCAERSWQPADAESPPIPRRDTHWCHGLTRPTVTPEQEATLTVGMGMDGHALAGTVNHTAQPAVSQAARVVCAAMLMDDGLIVPGVRHFSPDMRAVLHRIYGDGYHLRVKEQGFIDARGNFLSREEAWKRADMHGQIFLYDPSGRGRLIQQPANQGTTDILFSENLY